MSTPRGRSGQVDREKATTLEGIYAQSVINGADPRQLKRCGWRIDVRSTTPRKQYVPQVRIVQYSLHRLRRVNRGIGSVRNRLKNNGGATDQRDVKKIRQLMEAAVENDSETTEIRLSRGLTVCSRWDGSSI